MQILNIKKTETKLYSTDFKKIKFSFEDLWEVLALEGQISDQNEAKIQRKRP